MAKMMAEVPFRPCGQDPEELGGADRDQRAPRVDAGRQPVGYTEPYAAPVPEGAGRIGDKQCEPLESLRHACQRLRGLVGKQPQRWCADGQGDQGPHRCFADLLQAYGVGHPAGRLGGVRRRSQLLRNAAEDDLRLFPGLVTRSPRKVCRQPAPAGQSGEQSVHGPLQHRRAIAQLGGLCDRLIDDRIERRDPPDERASNRLRLRQARPAPMCRQIRA